MASEQTFKNFFSGGASLHHHSGTLSAAVSDSEFRSPDMHVSFPPLSASSTAPVASSASQHRGEMRVHGGGNRALGTSRTTGSASWGKTRAPVKRRGSLSSLGEGSSSGPRQQQRQTLKLADITDFDLTRPSAFDKLSDLYRDKSNLEGPSAHAVIGRDDREKEGLGKLKHKSQSGTVSHHVHLPRISMDSSPPLVSFRHSRIKPSTLTDHETGLPGKTHQPSPRTQSSSTASVDDGQLAPQTLPIRKNESSKDKHNSGIVADKTRNSAGSEKRRQLHVNTSALPSASSPKAVTAVHGCHETQDSTFTALQVQHKKDLESTISHSKIKLGTSQTGKRRDSTDTGPRLIQNSAPQDATGIETTVHLPPSTTRETLTTALGATSRTGKRPADHRGNTEQEPGGLSLSAYTSIVINNDGCEGETLSTVKSDTFLGERRTVRFSVSTEIIEYEPGSSLAGADRLSIDVDGAPCEVIAD